MERKSKVKNSYGIACCSYIDGVPHILLVKKRYTHAYSTLVNGNYDFNDVESIRRLFDGTTVEEKQDLLSLNFAIIWHRIWLGSAANGMAHARSVFERRFAENGGKFLRDMINGAKHAESLWEIPKGRRRNAKTETEIMCAVREFTEETGIAKSAYRVYPSSYATAVKDSMGTRYVSKYFFAACRYHVTPRIDVLNTQAEEICDIRWVSARDISMLDREGPTANIARQLFRHVRRSVVSVKSLRAFT